MNEFEAHESSYDHQHKKVVLYLFFSPVFAASSVKDCSCYPKVSPVSNC